ncbi:MAG: hypothetical protein RLZZ159_237 [Actinomycetota bacterium]|jgi:hypothetical protein
MKIKQLSYLISAVGVLVGILVSVRMGALAIAVALGFFVAPDIRGMRTIEKIIPVALIVALITIALALPRR